MNYGFIKVAAATPRIKVADCAGNAAAIVALIGEAAEKGVKLLVFPELCVTGATCGDLFLQAPLLDAAEKALATIREATTGKDMLVCVGLPLRKDGRVYDCAALLLEGELLGVVPKARPEGYAQRVFAPAPEQPGTIFPPAEAAFFASRLLLSCQNVPGLTLAVASGAELAAPGGTGEALASEGAAVLLHPFAVPELAGAAEERRALLSVLSRRHACAVVAAGAGEGESSTDYVFSGHRLIAENGAIPAESPLFECGLLTMDLDLELLAAERQKKAEPQRTADENTAQLFFALDRPESPVERSFPASPFVPAEEKKQAERWALLLQMQTEGLRKRLEHTRCQCPVLGISGGLDSTLALLVTVRACDRMGLDRKNILAVTMPGFGTTAHTKSNAELLCECLGVECRAVPITEAVRVHFKDIGQPEDRYDVTFENAQARERTQILMDLANQRGGLVVGTGDLSELALGWATYNGDHMSMYDVNGGVPKTLVRCLVAFEAAHTEDAALAEALRGILDTPVSPELLPPENGDISQKTENIVGPYELHDFFLYYLLRWGFGPKKLLFLAERAFAGQYERETIKGWLRVFLRRFFAQQFKRSCLPDGPAVGSVGLSPRGGWNMPSDAAAASWLAELEDNA